MKLFDDFLNRRFPEDEKVFWLHGEKMDVGGGKLTREEIDRLAAYPQLDTIRISGLRQDTFEYFIAKYGKQFKRMDKFQALKERYKGMPYREAFPEYFKQTDEKAREE